MRRARIAEKDKVIKIISNTFETKPGVNWLIKKRGSHKRKIHRLASYAFLKSYLREEAYISSNEKGIALCYRFNYHVFSITEILYQLRFAVYHYWEDPAEKIKFWFLRWEPSKLS